ncbi:helix-turn-helix domain-containing protein [Celeribacter halophilus]|uniref:Transcriptional regulator, contains XRE-family HTH domain n=1 Tax=Celeribacter halophilus TaxID=576117 RepID=A0A1I3Q480_9RHOB|nr:helix-turn-helix domain-containing protein [Celeribacter halophilus]PZX14049.1 transcriptional regulator with XRE-family HTH domain [Celeribacter halophilus]SFJ28515.1 Transcriptional regulator, contains XRE-family HTH domain [Celeribacter halophilus]
MDFQDRTVEHTESTFKDIGARLKAYRLGRNLTPEELAARLNISRAALYRAEKGGIAKIDMLTAIADELQISLPSLLGVGIEYVDNALSFFERMRQIEDDCDQIIGLFSPISYLVTTERYDQVLHDVLRESTQDENGENIAGILSVIKARKQKFKQARPLLASIISDADIRKFLREGLQGSADLDTCTRDLRRHMALEEVRHIVDMLRNPDIGVQIGVAREPIPSTSFQIVRKAGRSVLTISPFRLGHDPNIRVGVGMITSAPEALELHEGIAERLWATSLKGREAAEHIENLIARDGIKSPQAGD